MANAIGLAGWNRGAGKVAAFSKAITVSDLQNENFKRLFINTVHWCFFIKMNHMIDFSINCIFKISRLNFFFSVQTKLIER